MHKAQIAQSDKAYVRFLSPEPRVLVPHMSSDCVFGCNIAFGLASFHETVQNLYKTTYDEFSSGNDEFFFSRWTLSGVFFSFSRGTESQEDQHREPHGEISQQWKPSLRNTGALITTLMWQSLIGLLSCLKVPVSLFFFFFLEYEGEERERFYCEIALQR